MNSRNKPVLFCAGSSRKELVEFSLSSSATSHYVEFTFTKGSEVRIEVENIFSSSLIL